MMPKGKMLGLIGRNTVRNRGELALSAFGIVVGISSFVFFLGLSGGVRDVVLGENLFPLERLEVIAPKTNVGFSFGKTLDDGVVQRIRARPEVRYAIPRMLVSFPAKGTGDFEGKEIKFEVGGFTDGIESQFVEDEEFADLFKDWETDEYLASAPRCLRRDMFTCEETGYVCDAVSTTCVPGKSLARQLKRRGIAPNPPVPCDREDDFYCEDKEHSYCDMRDRKCHHRIPVIVSPTLLEIFNSSFAASHGLPRINEGLANFIRKQGGYARMRFTIGLGKTYVAGSTTKIDARPRDMEGYLVGINNKAMSIGMTIPIEYVKRWNLEYQGETEAKKYSSIVVMVKDKENIAGFSAWLRNTEKLELEDSQGERFAMAIFIVTTLFVFISFVIVGISAINIAHTFFMQVSERRREIGLLRAVGATRADVRLIILGEAGFIGLIGGTLGVGFAYGAAQLVDWASAKFLPAFPFKPETYFTFTPAILLGGLGFAVLFCVIGGFLPARKAANMEPAQALAAQ